MTESHGFRHCFQRMLSSFFEGFFQGSTDLRDGAAMSRKKISTTIYVTPEQSDRLKLLHERTKVPVAVYIREGIDLVLRHYAHLLPGQLPLDAGANASQIMASQGHLPTPMRDSRDARESVLKEPAARERDLDEPLGHQGHHGASVVNAAKK